MKLKEIINNIDIELIQGDLDTTVEYLSIDTRNIKPNTMFFCINGLSFDSHTAVDEIKAKGSSVIVVDRYLDSYPDATIIKVKDARKALSLCSKNFYDVDNLGLNFYSVTGTNGKTSITHFMKESLEKLDGKTASIGTLGFLIGDESINLDVKTTTTPDAIELNYLVSEFAKMGAKNVCLEVTSHGLLLDKCYGYKFKSAIFTNLTRDHLETHKTFENYAACKKKLFNMCENGIFNIDDEYAGEFIDESSCNVYTYSMNKDSDYRAIDVIYTTKSIEYKLIYNEKAYKVFVPVPGIFTVYNSLATIALLHVEGYDIEKIIEVFSHMSNVNGRIENVINNRNISILVDYAHTPDALSNIIESIKKSSTGRVICVFGCGGDRDATKREIMGEISGKLSDFSVITSDNPRFEDPASIIETIEEGIKRVTDNYVCIENRTEAIKYAIDMAKENDTIIIAGKGHETYQDIKGVKHDFSDFDVAREILGE